jgi:hypothetical protein
VLLSPIALERPDPRARSLAAAVTREQVRDSPEFDAQRSLTRHHEIDFVKHYGYPNWWGGTSMWNGGLYPCAMLPGYPGSGQADAEREREEAGYRAALRDRLFNDDPRLRGCRSVEGYRVHASDGDIGHVCGFLVDVETWAIRAMVLDTGDWWHGHKVLIAPQRIAHVSWADNFVSVALERESVMNAPHYDAHAPWGRGQAPDVYQAGRLEDPASSRALEAAP